MKIYEYEEGDADQRAPHNSGCSLSAEQISSLGVISAHLPNLEDVNDLATKRSYKNRDVITVSPSAMGDVYEDKVRMFFQEHLHEDEEIRYILDGTGYFDVRSHDEKWVRIEMSKGDLIILPAGIYHRFTTNEDNYVKAMRLFKDDPKWTPLNRAPELDTNVARKDYLEKFSKGLKMPQAA